MATERQVYWQGIIDKQTASGLTKADFFKLNKINPATYYYWFKKINSNKKLARNQILSIELTPQSHIPSQQSVELVLPNGYQLTFDASIGSAALVQILSALNS